MKAYRKPHASHIGGRILLWIVVVIFWIFYLFPIYWMLASSLKTQVDDFAIPPIFLFFQPTLDHYLAIFSNKQFMQVLRNSLAITGATVVASLFFGAWAAYAFARFRFHGNLLLSMGLIVARMMPPIVFIVPLYLMLN